MYLYIAPQRTGLIYTHLDSQGNNQCLTLSASTISDSLLCDMAHDLKKNTYWHALSFLQERVDGDEPRSPESSSSESSRNSADSAAILIDDPNLPMV